MQVLRLPRFREETFEGEIPFLKQASKDIAEWWWAELPLSADIRSRRGPLFAQTLGPQSPPTSGHRQNNTWCAE